MSEIKIIEKDENLNDEEKDKNLEIKTQKFESSLLHKKLNSFSCSDLKVVKHLNIVIFFFLQKVIDW
jgi:hypothetical protein